jgi:hypothetical protein
MQIFEANRDKVEKPRFIPNGTEILAPRRKRDVPKLISKVTPAYPASALEAGVGAMSYWMSRSRKMAALITSRSSTGILCSAEAATTAVRQWRYQTSAVSAKPVRFIVLVSLTSKARFGSHVLFGLHALHFYGF